MNPNYLSDQLTQLIAFIFLVKVRFLVRTIGRGYNEDISTPPAMTKFKNGVIAVCFYSQPSSPEVVFFVKPCTSFPKIEI